MDIVDFYQNEYAMPQEYKGTKTSALYKMARNAMGEAPDSDNEASLTRIAGDKVREITSQDVEKLRELEKSLTAAKAAAKSANATKSTFLATMSHEIRYLRCCSRRRDRVIWPDSGAQPTRSNPVRGTLETTSLPISAPVSNRPANRARSQTLRTAALRIVKACQQLKQELSTDVEEQLSGAGQ